MLFLVAAVADIDAVQENISGTFHPHRSVKSFLQGNASTSGHGDVLRRTRSRDNAAGAGNRNGILCKMQPGFRLLPVPMAFRLSVLLPCLFLPV